MSILAMLDNFMAMKTNRGSCLVYRISPTGERLYHHGFGKYLADREGAIRYDAKDIPRLLLEGNKTELA